MSLTLPALLISGLYLTRLLVTPQQHQGMIKLSPSSQLQHACIQNILEIHFALEGWKEQRAVLLFEDKNKVVDFLKCILLFIHFPLAAANF